MKVVFDSMMWVSYVSNRGGWRYRVIEQARKSRARLFASDYILDEVVTALREGLGESARFARRARAAILRRAKLVSLPKTVPSFVVDDPKDNAVIQTALTGKADCVVTADKVLLALGKVRDVEILDLQTFVEHLPSPRK